MVLFSVLTICHRVFTTRCLFFSLFAAWKESHERSQERRPKREKRKRLVSLPCRPFDPLRSGDRRSLAQCYSCFVIRLRSSPIRHLWCFFPLFPGPIWLDRSLKKMNQRLKLQQQQQALMQQAMLQQQQLYHSGVLAAAMSQVGVPLASSLD